MKLMQAGAAATLIVVLSLTGAVRADDKKPDTKPSATKQLNYATQGAPQRNHVFDGTRAPPGPVRANPAPKPSPVGQAIYSSPGHPGYKPAPPSLHINPVPSPSVARSTTTVTSPPSVVRSTTTVSSPPPTVARSSTTATAPVKKP